MNEPLESDGELERLVHGGLRELPMRRAPLSLESRVLEELQRRAALPWWRRSFARWPFAARVGFSLLCAGLAALAALGAARAVVDLGSLEASRTLSIPWVSGLLALVDIARELMASLAALPAPDWLYEVLGAAALLYAALFGLGITAYRTLYLNTSRQ
jgi:hypothetical protein